MCIWNLLNSNLEFKFAKPLQYTSIKWNCQQISTLYIMLQHHNMCLSIVLVLIVPFPHCLLSVEVAPKPEVIPEAEDCQYDPCQQGKQTLIDHVDKNPVPSHSRLCMFRMSP